MNSTNPSWTLKFIWGALLAMQFAYLVVVGNLFGSPFAMSFPSPSAGIELPLAMTAMMSLGAAILLPQLLLKVARKTVQDPSDAQQVGKAVFVPFIIRWALLESVTIYGLVLCFMAKDAGKLLPFFLISFAGYLASFPSDQRIRDWATGRA